MAFGFTESDLSPCFHDKDHISFEQFLQAIEGKTTGAVRASLGIASNFADVYNYVRFAESFIDRPVRP
jgi:hypothetical protein